MLRYLYARILFLSLAPLLLPKAECQSQPSQAKDTIILVGDNTFRPFEFLNSRKEPVGILVDMWKRWGQLTNTTVIYRCTTWYEAQQLVKDHKADALGGAMRTPERESYLEFVDVVLTIYDYVYYNDKSIVGFKGLNSIGDKVDVGIVKGDIAVDYVRTHFPDVPIKEFANYETLVKAALDDSLFLFVMEPPVARYFFAKYKKLKSDFSQSKSYLFKEDLYAAIRKDKTELIKKAKIGFKKFDAAERNKIFSEWSYTAENSLESEFARFINENQNSKYVLATIIFYLICLAVWYLLYAIHSKSLIYIYAICKRSFSTKFEFFNIYINLSLDRLILLRYFTFSNKVVNDWLSDQSQAKTNIEKMPVFKERTIFSPTPLKIDNKVIDDPNSFNLQLNIRNELSKAILENKIVFITGEGGSGKTSIAINIARWLVADRQFLGELRIPVFIDSDLPIKPGAIDQTQNAIFSFICSYCQWLFGYKIDDEWIIYLIRKRRFVVIVDGISELTSETKMACVSYTETYNSNIIVTTRNAGDYSDFRQDLVTLSPLRLKGIYVSLFIENILTLRKIRLKFSDAEFYDSCKFLSEVSNDQDITILFAMLFIDVIAKQKEDMRDVIHAKSIPDLVIMYIKSLNKKVRNKQNDNEIISLLKNVSWIIIKNDLLPTPTRRELVIKELSAFLNLDAKLEYLIKTLNVVNEFDQLVPKLKFSLDPVCEYLAALFVVDSIIQGDGSLITKIQQRSSTIYQGGINHMLSSNEFIVAFCECCFALDAADLNLVLREKFVEELLDNYKKQNEHV